MKTPAEWLKQVDYDMDTADAMFAARRYLYAAFMCHLSVEKALKALFLERTKNDPPKSHNLLHFLTTLGIVPPPDILRFLTRLNESSIATRYPEELDITLGNYTESVTQDILTDGKEAVKWIKAQF